MVTLESVADGDRPVVQAHRGFAGVAPENTIRAARLAAERFDADWIEVDVQPTADGTPVCFHDPALGTAEGSRNLTDASGLVRATPTADVLAAEVMDSGETIPRLSDFLGALPADVGVNVELKSPGGPIEDDDLLLFEDNRTEQRDLWDAVLADVAPVLAEHVDERPIVCSSFFGGALAAAREHAPDVPRAIVVGADLAEGLAAADRLDAAAVNPPAGRLLEAGAPVVDRAHDAGYAVTAWTVTEWTTVRELAAIGVDGVIADYPFVDATL